MASTGRLRGHAGHQGPTGVPDRLRRCVMNVRRDYDETLEAWFDRLEAVARERGMAVVIIGEQEPAQPPPPRSFGLAKVREATPSNELPAPTVYDL